VPCYFCAVLGMGTAHAGWADGKADTLNIKATAAIMPVNAATGVLPLGIDFHTPLTYGTQIVLKQGMVGAGNWDPVALGGNGASVYRSNLDNGYGGLLTVGQWLETEPGNVVGPTQSGMSQRLTAGQ